MKILNCYEIPKYDVGDTLRYEERKSQIGDIKKGDIFTVLRDRKSTRLNSSHT